MHKTSAFELNKKSVEKNGITTQRTSNNFKIIIKPFTNLMKLPLWWKCFRGTVIVIGIFKMLTALLFMLMAVVGLAYFEDTKNLLQMGIAVTVGQRRRYTCMHTVYHNGSYEEWAYIRTKSSDPSYSIDATVILYTGATAAFIYWLSCLGLLIGILRNRHQLFIPWMFIDLLGMVSAMMLMMEVSAHDNAIGYVNKLEFLVVGLLVVLINLNIWAIIRVYYVKLIARSKLANVPMVSIASTGTETVTCPAGNDAGLKQIVLHVNETSDVI